MIDWVKQTNKQPVKHPLTGQQCQLLPWTRHREWNLAWIGVSMAGFRFHISIIWKKSHAGSTHILSYRPLFTQQSMMLWSYMLEIDKYRTRLDDRKSRLCLLFWEIGESESCGLEPCRVKANFSLLSQALCIIRIGQGLVGSVSG